MSSLINPADNVPHQEKKEGFMGKIHRLEWHNPLARELKKQKLDLLKQRQANRRAIDRGQFDQIKPYDLEAIIPNIQTYPLRLSRKSGELITPDVKKQPGIKTKPGVPGVGYPTVDEVKVMAIWGAVPISEPSNCKDIEAQKTYYHLVDDAQSEAMIRYLEVKRFIVLQKLIEHERGKSPKGFDPNNIEVTDQEVQEYLQSPGTFAELTALTVVTRIGQHLEPKLNAYRANAKVDMFLNIDLITCIEDFSNQGYCLNGIDVTTNSTPENAWKKTISHERTEGMFPRLTHPGENVTMPINRNILLMPRDIDWFHAHDNWQSVRGDSYLAGDCILTPAQCKWIAEAAFLKIVGQKDGEPIYTLEQIHAAYEAAYANIEQASAAV